MSDPNAWLALRLMQDGEVQELIRRYENALLSQEAPEAPELMPPGVGHDRLFWEDDLRHKLLSLDPGGSTPTVAPNASIWRLSDASIATTGVAPLHGRRSDLLARGNTYHAAESGWKHLGVLVRVGESLCLDDERYGVAVVRTSALGTGGAHQVLVRLEEAEHGAQWRCPRRGRRTLGEQPSSNQGTLKHSAC